MSGGLLLFAAVISIENSRALGADAGMDLTARVEKLPILDLPDEWYSIDASIPLPERWMRMAALQSHASTPGGRQEHLARKLASKYDNNGKPFRHVIFFNRLWICRICGQSHGASLTTVVFGRRNLFVQLTAEEIHAVSRHGAPLPPEKEHLLTAMLAPQTRNPEATQ